MRRNPLKTQSSLTCVLPTARGRLSRSSTPAVTRCVGRGARCIATRGATRRSPRWQRRCRRRGPAVVPALSQRREARRGGQRTWRVLRPDQRSRCGAHAPRGHGGRRLRRQAQSRGPRVQERWHRKHCRRGRGARGVWLEIKASIYDRPILVPAEAEAGVTGCAMIAAIAGGAAADWAEVRKRFVSFADEIRPNPQWRDRYLRYAELFDARYESNRTLWEWLHALDASG